MPIPFPADGRETAALTSDVAEAAMVRIAQPETRDVPHASRHQPGNPSVDKTTQAAKRLAQGRSRSAGEARRGRSEGHDPKQIGGKRRGDDDGNGGRQIDTRHEQLRIAAKIDLRRSYCDAHGLSWSGATTYRTRAR